MLYENLLYFDIETTSQYRSLDEFKINDSYGHNIFVKKYNKSKFFRGDTESANESYLEQAPIYSAYGKILCISFGYFKNGKPVINSIYGDDEEDIIYNFNMLLDKVGKKHMMISGYKSSSFDVPWIVHKLNKYDIEPCSLLNIYGMKPWDIKSIDLADEWKQRFSKYVPLEEVAYELGIVNPKNDMSGDMVHNVYWEEDNGLERIKTYCESDVLTTMLIGERLLKYKM